MLNPDSFELHKYVWSRISGCSCSCYAGESIIPFLVRIAALLSSTPCKVINGKVINNVPAKEKWKKQILLLKKGTYKEERNYRRGGFPIPPL
jgi:hypothetical protein